MNSFRAVATQSLESAVLSYDLRQAKGKVAIRTMLITGLVILTIIVFLANMMHAIQFDMLTKLMTTAVGLAVVELCLRIHTIQKQQKCLVSATLTPTPRQAKRSPHALEGDETPVE